MAGEDICIAALPGAWAGAEIAGGDEPARVRLVIEGLDGEGGDTEREAAILPTRLLARGMAAPGARQALAGASTVLVLLPTGRFDDGVWAPIIERLLGEVVSGRRIVLAWCGLEPFLVPFGRRAPELWSDPRLAPALVSVLARHLRSLAAVVRECEAVASAGSLRQGFARFEPVAEGMPARLSLALA